jgi:hypothetical protein
MNALNTLRNISNSYINAYNILKYVFNMYINADNIEMNSCHMGTNAGYLVSVRPTPSFIPDVVWIKRCP